MFEEKNNFKIGIHRRIFNKNLKEAIERSGFTAAQIKKETKIGESYLSQIINFKRFPSEYEKVALAKILIVPVDHLFPEKYEIIYEKLNPLGRDMEFKVNMLALDSPEVLLLPANETRETMDDDVDLSLKSDFIRTLMEGILNKREKRIIELRFGFDGHSRSLEEIGHEFGVYRERIRQIEAKALYKIKKAIRDNEYLYKVFNDGKITDYQYKIEHENDYLFREEI